MFIYLAKWSWYLPGGSVIKNPPAMQETQEMQVLSLGREDTLGKGMVTHSSILAWKIPWTEEPGGLQSMGSKELDTTKHLTHIFWFISLI